VHPNLHEDFGGLEAGGGEAVVVGDAGSFSTYERLNLAFRKIIHGGEFLALAKNRNFLDSDFELSLDAVLLLRRLNMPRAEKHPCSANRRPDSLNLPPAEPASLPLMSR
jgi:hypothetical protein